MSALLKLAERCEAATGPDRRLDALIHIALNPDEQHIIGHEPGRFPQKAIYGPATAFLKWLGDAEPMDVEAIVGTLRAEPVTASLDAAMTLVPEGWHVSHSGEGRFMTRGKFAAMVETWGLVKADDGSDIHTTPSRRNGVAQTFALALCAAALRARAASVDTHPKDGDVEQAPLVSGAVPKADAQGGSHDL